jgi:hypothetical protein
VKGLVVSGGRDKTASSCLSGVVPDKGTDYIGGEQQITIWNIFEKVKRLFQKCSKLLAALQQIKRGDFMIINILSEAKTQG